MGALENISPLDGRYAKAVSQLSRYFSELGLMRYRVMVEVRYLIGLSKIGVVRKLSSEELKLLEGLYKNFSEKDGQEIKEIEKITNHDVKSIEYFIKKKLAGSLKDVTEMIHFALTSEDVTNLAYALILKDFLNEVYIEQIKEVNKKIIELADKYKAVPMLARTHGQPASPTTLGKEWAVFAHRLGRQEKQLNAKPLGKLNCASGNYNAAKLAFPNIDWISFSKEFITSLGLEPNLITTQIESHDGMCELFHSTVKINNILLDLCRDVWTYISLDYLAQKTKPGEVGSSTMPHKVNPIDFENAEGNLGMANSVLDFLANNLPISRLQRDLSDSTVQRNIGVGFGHSILAYKSLLKGLEKIEANKAVIAADLENHSEILAEAIQTILRRERKEMPYEKLKELTRGKKVTMADLQEFIKTLDVDDKVKEELLKLTPSSYIGEAVRLVELVKK